MFAKFRIFLYFVLKPFISLKMRRELKYKTGQLIVYLAQQLSKLDTYGAIMLNKALYFIDCYSYVEKKEPISGFTYIKQNFGPTPDPHSFLHLRDQLIDDKKIAIEEQEYYGYTQKRLVALDEPDLSVFQTDELEIIKDVLRIFEDLNLNARDLSDITHNHFSWQFAEPGKELPLYTILLTKRDVSNEDLTWAKKSIKEFEAHTYN